jgi:hypothetical protein
MSDARERELNYPGRVDPAKPTVLGPGLDGRAWIVTASIYDTAADASTLSLSEIPRQVHEAAAKPEPKPPIVAGRREIADLLFRRRRPQPRESA